MFEWLVSVFKGKRIVGKDYVLSSVKGESGLGQVSANPSIYMGLMNYQDTQTLIYSYALINMKFLDPKEVDILDSKPFEYHGKSCVSPFIEDDRAKLRLFEEEVKSICEDMKAKEGSHVKVTGWEKNGKIKIDSLESDDFILSEISFLRKR